MVERWQGATPALTVDRNRTGTSGIGKHLELLPGLVGLARDRTHRLVTKPAPLVLPSSPTIACSAFHAASLTGRPLPKGVELALPDLVFSNLPLLFGNRVHRDQRALLCVSVSSGAKHEINSRTLEGGSYEFPMDGSDCPNRAGNKPLVIHCPLFLQSPTLGSGIRWHLFLLLLVRGLAKA